MSEIPARMTISFMDGTSEEFLEPQHLYHNFEPGILSFYCNGADIRIPFVSIKKIVAVPVETATTTVDATKQ